MSSIKWNSSASGVLLVLVLSGIVAYRVLAQVGGGDGCACVVSVNLPAVLEGLAERGEAEAELRTMADEMIAEDSERKQVIEDLRKQFTDIPEADREARADLGDRLTLEVLEYQGWRAYSAERLDIEKSLQLRELDRRVRRAIDDLAMLKGYDFVLMDDTSAELSVNPESKLAREVQVKQQMTARRSLYVNPAMDITDQLIQRMNNAFNAGG